MENILKEKIKEAVRFLYNSEISDELATVSETRKDFKGDFTLVVFPLLKYSKESPEKTATAIGEYLTANFKDVSGFNVIKGFLNLEISNSYWLENFREIAANDNIANSFLSENPQTILIEYSSPNTNKPLHLGHIRNNLLGFSLYRILYNENPSKLFLICPKCKGLLVLGEEYSIKIVCGFSDKKPLVMLSFEAISLKFASQ